MAEPFDHSSIENLEVWKKALEMSVLICQDILPRLPADERYCLTSQLRRSAQSIPANIAEGVGRYYYQETIRFCYIARGSLEETYSHIIMAKRLNYLSEVEIEKFLVLTIEIRKLIAGFIEYLKRSKRGESEPGSQVGIRDSFENYIIGTFSEKSADQSR